MSECACIAFVFLCTPSTYCFELTSSIVLQRVACKAGYSACVQPASEPALKLYTCAEKRSRHFSAVCLDQCSLWRYALFESSSVGDLFPGPWLFASVETMGPLYLHMLLLWDLASYFQQLYKIPLQPCLLLLLHCREMQLNQGEMQWKRDAGRGLQELDCGADKFHIGRVNMFLSCYPACTLTHGVWKRWRRV